MLSCFYSHLLSTGRPLSSLKWNSLIIEKVLQEPSIYFPFESVLLTSVLLKKAFFHDDVGARLVVILSQGQ